MCQKEKINENDEYVIDKKYVESVKNKIKFDVRGKSRSGITGLAFRIDLRP